VTETATEAASKQLNLWFYELIERRVIYAQNYF